MSQRDPGWMESKEGGDMKPSQAARAAPPAEGQAAVGEGCSTPSCSTSQVEALLGGGSCSTSQR